MNGEHYTRSFLIQRRALQQFYAALPEDKAHFKAWEGGMDFLEQANHIVSSTQLMLSMLEGRQMPREAAATNLSGVRQRLENNAKEVVSALSRLQAADVARPIPTGQMSVAALLDMLIGHEVHHKGQVWLMARMVDIAPPNWMKMG